MRISVIGTGYVGITTAVVLAYLGHDVVCVDQDEEKIEALKRGEPPIYEPFLKELLDLSRARLTFTTSYAEAVPASEVIFIAVGTPPRPDGSPDLRYVRAAADELGRHLGRDFTVVVNKSTVPIGSGQWVQQVIEAAFFEQHGRDLNGRVAVASNPEFLRESSAVFDTLYPDRIVVGARDARATERMTALYDQVLNQSFEAPAFLPRPVGLKAVELITTDSASAEMIKYAANAFLALKISYMNEVGTVATKVGADVKTVARGIGLDPRIGTRFLQAGLGWGGSCFGKDTSALLTTAFEHGVAMSIVHAAREVNGRMRVRVIEKLRALYPSLEGKRISLLGLAFKPDTDDLRDAPVVEIIRRLTDHGARVSAHDPKALERFRKEYAGAAATLVERPETLFDGADAVVLVTEWQEYLDLDWSALKKRMAAPVVLDGRNVLDRKTLEADGWTYLSIP